MKPRLPYAQLAPAAFRALAGLEQYLRESSIEKPLRELVKLRASQINGCAYCIDMHSRDLIKGGTTVEKLVLVSVWPEAGGLFTAQERAALRWAETVTRVAETAVPDEEFQAVAAHFPEKELADLTIAIGLMNVYNRIAISFRRPPDAAAH